MVNLSVMEKKMAQIIIEGSLFNVDYENRQFVRAYDSSCKCSFTLLQSTDSYYHGYYDLDRKRFTTEQAIKPDMLGVSVVTVTIPASVIKGAYPDKDIARNLNDRSYQENWGVLLMDGRIEKRLSGELPKIDIAGTEYIVDWRLQELRKANDFADPINLKFLPITAEGDGYLAFYHLTSKQVVDIFPTVTSMPDEVVLLQIPNELKLDPIGVARQYGLEDTSLLRKHPIEDNLKATIIPLSETMVPEIIQQNRKRQGFTEKPQNESKKRKGNRL